MRYAPYETQNRQKQEHRNAILALLNERRMSFTQLLKSTGFSPMGLTNMLNDLKKESKIEKEDPKNKKSPYKIKGAGIRAKELFFPGPKIYDVRDTGGKYFFDLPDYSASEIFDYAPAFGIMSHLLLDKKIGKKYRPLWRKEIFEIEKFVYDKIFTKHHDEGLTIDESLKAQVFLILEIDYDELAKIIKTRTKQENDKLAKDKLLELKLNP